MAMLCDLRAAVPSHNGRFGGVLRGISHAPRRLRGGAISMIRMIPATLSSTPPRSLRFSAGCWAKCSSRGRPSRFFDGHILLVLNMPPALIVGSLRLILDQVPSQQVRNVSIEQDAEHLDDPPRRTESLSPAQSATGNWPRCRVHPRRLPNSQRCHRRGIRCLQNGAATLHAGFHFDEGANPTSP